jgi:hypothetical protein
MCEHIESCRIKVLRVSGTMAQPYRTRLSAIAQIRDDIFNLAWEVGQVGSSTWRCPDAPTGVLG